MIDREIGEFLSRRRQELGRDHKQSAALLADATGLNERTAGILIRSYEAGCVYGTTSDVGAARDGDIHLNRLAHYIKTLGLVGSELRTLIDTLTLLDERFVYPPKEEKTTITQHRSEESRQRMFARYPSDPP